MEIYKEIETTASKEFVKLLNSQLSKNKVEEGKIVDMKDAIRTEMGVEDAYLKIYPVSGYGNEDLLREVLEIEKPDAILHYTDPRFWIWLYQMEHEVRQHIPIFYYNIWDDRPTPRYNEFFYESCDLIMNISKQTVAMVRDAAVKKPRNDWNNTYIPHGIPEDIFVPIFALGRVPGWALNVIEQSSNNMLIRPLTEYTGPFDVEYVPIEDRES